MSTSLPDERYGKTDAVGGNVRVLIATGFFPGAQMGGAEYQSFLLAKGLLKRGHVVRFMATHGGDRREYAEAEIRVSELPGWARVGDESHQADIRRVVQEFRPDICYVRIFTDIYHIMAVCSSLGIPVVTVSCSGYETSPFLLGKHPRETLGHLRAGNTRVHFHSFRAIRHAAAHVCNTRDLARMTQRWFPNKQIHAIYNGSPPPPIDEIHTSPTGQVIWINNLKRVKRPEMYLSLARKLPHYRFLMIGGLYNDRFGNAMRKKLSTAPNNLTYLGRLPVDKVNRHIQESDLLLYTSKPGFEGLGNSFLQAWFRSVPTVCTFPMDGIQEREDIGRTVFTLKDLTVCVDDLMRNDESRLQMGERARRYAMNCHSDEKMVSDYETLFQKLAIN